MNRTMPRSPTAAAQGSARGFTLIELMITLAVLAAVVLVLTTVMYGASRSKTSSSNSVESSQAARVAMDMMARDLRSAGYGADIDAQQPPIAYIDSMQVLISANLTPFPDTTGNGHSIPLAYEPTGSPRPYPLNGTSWQPPMRYRTGAELVRWTLDVNNDGVVDANDLQAAEAVDARRTLNPSDYELVRQVYGDSTNASAGNNGGTTERVALVRAPGAGVPPMFQVYLNSSATPWNWSSGPVPAAELKNITRVTVQVTAASSKPDWLGRYASTTYRTDVGSLRNAPGATQVTYAVDGYVFNDLNQNNYKDGTEPGLAGASVSLGMYSTTTSGSGYFLFDVPAGTYKLRHVPPTGYGVFSNPDSFSVTVGPPVTRSFADTARTGGIVTAYVFNDANNNGVQDVGETQARGVKLTMTPGGKFAVTDTSGHASFFAQVGGWSLNCTAPDSFAVSTPNPVTGTMTNGGTGSATFGVYRASIGTIKGTVFTDNNQNGLKDGVDAGIQNVWVGVTDDGGTHILGYTYTDAGGAYSIDVAANDPPHTTPYSIFVIPPTHSFPTTPTSINNVWLQVGQTLSGQNFGMMTFTTISLTATRVLSLGSADLVEKDWNGSLTGNRHGDRDLVLGADAGGTDQISVWFNGYSGTIFSGSPDYTRAAPNAVMALALDTLETATVFRRPDMVTGTKATASGNFFVWLMQNSSGNEGEYPNSYTTGMNYKTNDQGDVQAVLTTDCAGGAGPDMPDIIVGTKSPTAGQGSVEVWRNNNASPIPSFTRDQVMTASGTMGEVNAMCLTDLNGDGYKDLVVATRTGNYTGQLLFYKFISKNTVPHYQLVSTWVFGSDILTNIVSLDVDEDGNRDLVVGTQTATGGALYYLRNITPATLSFGLIRRVDAPGQVTSMVAADFGGGPVKDVAVGYRVGTTGFVGGLRIYYMDLHNLPATGVDPSSGTMTNWVPALNAGNFNYGIYPSTPPPPYLTDLAAGVKTGVATGNLLVFIR